MRTVTFPGRFESLDKISKFVTQAARSAGLDEQAVYAVELAVDEACSNIIDHAYGGEGRGDIECGYSVSDAGLTVTLYDWGTPFNPAEVSRPKLHLPLKKVKRRGVGLFLIRKMVDQVIYEQGPDGRNIWTLVKLKR